MLTQAESSGALRTRSALTGLVDSITSHLAVDETAHRRRDPVPGDESRALWPRDIRFVTVPMRGTAMVDGASIVRLNEPGTRRMFAAVARGEFEPWYANNPGVESCPRPADQP